jgi:hypothetical protein
MSQPTQPKHPDQDNLSADFEQLRRLAKEYALRAK